jgi:hypothetical protein
MGSVFLFGGDAGRGIAQHSSHVEKLTDTELLQSATGSAWARRRVAQRSLDRVESLMALPALQTPQDESGPQNGADGHERETAAATRNSGRSGGRWHGSGPSWSRLDSVLLCALNLQAAYLAADFKQFDLERCALSLQAAYNPVVFKPFGLDRRRQVVVILLGDRLAADPCSGGVGVNFSAFWKWNHGLPFRIERKITAFFSFFAISQPSPTPEK